MTDPAATTTPAADSHSPGGRSDRRPDRRADRAPPRGPFRRTRTALALLAELALAFALLCWLAGRLVSDRYLFTQYLSWIPTEAVVALALLVLAAGCLLRWKRPRLPVLAATVAIAGWLVLAEWRAHRFVLPAPARGELRVLFMNISPGSRDASLDPLFATDPDIAVLSNVHPQPKSFAKIYGVEHQELLEEFTGIVPGESPPGEAHLVRYGMFHIYSEHPIRRRATAHVGTQETWLANDTGGTGAILMLEIDTPAGPRTVWAVDMPSTVGASRRELFEEARARIESTSRGLAIDGIGRWVGVDLDPDDPLLTPDLVVGDFNTPAHAWSVDLLAPTTRNARSDAGAGPPGTFRATDPYPVFEIDLAMLGPSIRATHLTTLRAPGCRHLGLVIDLEDK